MNNTRSKSYNLKELSIIIIPFLIFYRCFNYKPFVEATWYNDFLSLAYIVFFCCAVPVIFRKYSNTSISRCIKYLIFLFLGAIITGYLSSGQSLYNSLRAIGPTMLICMYFIMIEYKISSRSIVQAFVIIFIINTIVHLFALGQFPDNVFAYSSVLADRAAGDEDSRGIIRVAAPASDFVILCIFFVLNLRYKSKKFLLLLIPLFTLLVMRGTRTPLIMTILLCCLYVTWKFKNKWVLFLIFFFAYFELPAAYDSILKSNSNNIIVKYVKLTNAQVSNSEDDIRFEMAKYYIFDYNRTPLQVFWGNGVPFGTSSYGQKISENCDNGYFMDDVGYVQVYIQYGILGILIYLLLLYKIIKTPVVREYEYAKLFVIYYFMVSITGCYLINQVYFMSFALYLMETNKRPFGYIKKLKRKE